MNKDEFELFNRAVQSLEKLNVETARLRTDVHRLSGRIEPFENEKVTAFEPFASSHLKNMRDVLNHFERVRQGLIASQKTISKLEARIDQIHNDSWSRDDMKPWLR